MNLKGRNSMELDKVKDRGTKKWAPFASMPEQFSMLRKMYLDETKIKKPVLDDGEIEMINNHLRDSLQERAPLLFKVFKDGFIEELVGIVQQVDTIQRRIKILDNKDYIRFIRFDEITGAEPD